MKKDVLYYKIFCKCCEGYFSLDVENEHVSVQGHLMLNCHRCNDYCIYVKGGSIVERIRYGIESISKPLRKKKPEFSFFRKLE